MSDSPVSVPGPLILYASHSGNSEAIAKLIHSDLVPYVASDLSAAVACPFPITIAAPRVMPFSALLSSDSTLASVAKERCVLLLVSTTGQGDIPDNGRSFHRQLRRLEKAADSPSRIWPSVRYAALGLGDTNYDRFNGALKTMEKGWQTLGAIRVAPSALADDGTGLEIVVDPWVASVPDLVVKMYKDAIATGDIVGPSCAPSPAPAPTIAAPTPLPASAAAAAAAAATVVSVSSPGKTSPARLSRPSSAHSHTCQQPNLPLPALPPPTPTAAGAGSGRSATTPTSARTPSGSPPSSARSRGAGLRTADGFALPVKPSLVIKAQPVPFTLRTVGEGEGKGDVVTSAAQVLTADEQRLLVALLTAQTSAAFTSLATTTPTTTGSSSSSSAAAAAAAAAAVVGGDVCGRVCGVGAGVCVPVPESATETEAKSDSGEAVCKAAGHSCCCGPACTCDPCLCVAPNRACSSASSSSKAAREGEGECCGGWRVCPVASDPVIVAGIALPLLNAARARADAAAAAGAAASRPASNCQTTADPFGFTADTPVLGRVAALAPLCRSGDDVTPVAGAAVASKGVAAASKGGKYDPRVVLQMQVEVPAAVAALMPPLARVPAPKAAHGGAAAHHRHAHGHPSVPRTLCDGTKDDLAALRTSEDGTEDDDANDCGADARHCVWYRPGDCISVITPAPPAAVYHALRRLSLLPPPPAAAASDPAAAAAAATDPSVLAAALAPVTFAGASEGSDSAPAPAPVPNHLPGWLRRLAESPAYKHVFSLHALLFHGVDIAAPPRRALLRALADRCTNTADAERLFALVSRDGKQCADGVINAQALSLAEVLSLLPSAVPDAAAVIEHSAALQPRVYSIASTPLPAELPCDATTAGCSNKEGKSSSASRRRATVYATVVRSARTPAPVAMSLLPTPAQATAAAAASPRAAGRGMLGSVCETSASSSSDAFAPGSLLDIPPVCYPGSTTGPFALAPPAADATAAAAAAGADPLARRRADKVALFARAPAPVPAHLQPVSRASAAEAAAADAAAADAAAGTDVVVASAAGGVPKRVSHGVATGFLDSLTENAPVAAAAFAGGSGCGRARSWLSLPGRIELVRRARVCSGACSAACVCVCEERLTFVPMNIHTSPSFRLPCDGLTSPSADAFPETPMTPLPAAAEAAAAGRSPPLVLVGPGTGVAPFLGFLRHLHAMRQMRAPSKTVGEDGVIVTSDGTGFKSFANPLSRHYLPDRERAPQHQHQQAQQAPEDVVLFTGCRRRTVDAIAAKELTALVAAGAAEAVHWAYSREKDGGKVYVQDLIARESLSVAEAILRRHAVVMVCGDGVRMARSVLAAIETAIATHAPAFWAPNGTVASSNGAVTEAEEAAAAETAARAAGLLGPGQPGPVTGLGVLDFSPAKLPKEQVEVWARAYVARLSKVGRYKTDVWSN